MFNLLFLSTILEAPLSRGKGIFGFGSEQEAQDSILYSYTKSFNGFAAKFSGVHADKLRGQLISETYMKRKARQKRGQMNLKTYIEDGLLWYRILDEFRLWSCISYIPLVQQCVCPFAKSPL
jgi:hypothetical protein